jgi:hypothetical protein
MKQGMQAKTRDARLDAIKWIAMATMVIDHFRFIYHDVPWLFSIGRIAFPLFCLVIAVHIYSKHDSQLVNEKYSRYVFWMISFSIISEVPYQYFFNQSKSLNVMPTLTLGLLICISMHHIKNNLCKWILSLTLFSSVIFKSSLMYGVLGSLLPVAFMFALMKPSMLWPLPVIICIFSNYSLERIGEILSDTGQYNTSAFIIAGLTPVLGMMFIHSDLKLRIPPVGRWGYVFYPAHIVILYFIRNLLEK